jgi:hypothetical protein
VRESIGGTWITGLVITFMLIFVAFLSLSLNYTKAFQMKNEMLTILEKYEGINANSIEIINNYLSKNGYSTTGTCDKGNYGVSNLDSNAGSIVSDESAQYYYCISSNTSTVTTNGKNFTTANYTVKIYFNFNLPVIGDIFKFKISGTTNNIAKPQSL